MVKNLRMEADMAISELMGSSAKFRALSNNFDMVAPVDSAALIRGATGARKEVIARVIHVAAPRRNRLVALNCAAIPSMLLESELFGCEKAAFAGTVSQTVGRFHQAMEQARDDRSSGPVFSRALSVISRMIREWRAVIWGLHTASVAPAGLERAFSNLLHEVIPCRAVSLRIVVQGKPRTLNPTIQEQLFLIGREAIVNALRHSAATEIEVEVQYLRSLLCLFVRDNGCGINGEEIQKVGNSQSGLRRMRDGAANIGARFGIWSRLDAGTEVRVAVPVEIAIAPA